MKICCLHVLILFCIVWDHWVSTVVYTPDMMFVRLESELLSVEGEAPKLFCVASVCILLSRCVPWPHFSLMPHTPFFPLITYSVMKMTEIYHFIVMNCLTWVGPLYLLNHLHVGVGAWAVLVRNIIWFTKWEEGRRATGRPWKDKQGGSVYLSVMQCNTQQHRVSETLRILCNLELCHLELDFSKRFHDYMIYFPTFQTFHEWDIPWTAVKA